MKRQVRRHLHSIALPLCVLALGVESCEVVERLGG
jgi:hypothetical protein